VVYIAAAPLELFFFNSPRVRALLHVEADNVADVRMWAFWIGFHNLLAGIGAIVGFVILWTGDEAVSRAVVVTALCYMLLASLAMGIADLLGLWRPRGGSVLGTLGSRACPRWSPSSQRPSNPGTEFLRSATSLRSGVVRLQTATVIAHRDHE
jgi:putative membrane protein